ncbi:zinc ribbon domain-containing protein [Halomicroarcula sp. F13]|uniref:Zinc ribbon domain-containing protein n=1 Tax=Haloarcula rubra TaxID=2487747 RepID=A0AAW4PQX0_9EURY|nr:zinc ribbon domain-containing protein [Halomicroarcula rubra]MBX0322702.1 zinc ribbon domain-containing protein [Halomicroarcula rubra]
MGVLDNITDLFASDSVDKYRCDDCDAVFEVEGGTRDPHCESCGSAAVTFINRV